MPAFLAKILGDNMTKPFTLAFSNIPGIIQPISTKGMKTTGQLTSFISVGRCAVSIILMSYHETIQYSVLVDTCVGIEPNEIVKRFDAAIMKYIELAQTSEGSKKEN